jgi:D-beta-D-heptose 7-phosphate kinase/D-beta-D-heptose 1-phosphate adenosyltransferase
MPKTKFTVTTAECRSQASGYLSKISNTLFAALKAHQLKLRGNKVVVTNGCFDILHVGHIKFLEAAKAKGDYLIVGVNSDKAVSVLKGPRRPINKQGDRMAIIAALECVDLVVLVDAVRVNDFLDAIQPTIWAKGGDYTASTLDQGEVEAARRANAEIALLKLVEGVSTTNVIATIRQKHEGGGTQQRSRRK